MLAQDEAAAPALRADRFPADDLEFSWLSSRTPGPSQPFRLARGPRDCALASVQVEGRGQARQDGRTAALSEGAMTFLDARRPYSLCLWGPFCQLIVQVPLALLPARALSSATAVELPPAGPGRIVADFIVGFGRQHQLDPLAAAALTPHSVELLRTAVTLAASRRADVPGDALTRDRIHRYLQQHAHDPVLSADAVAASCGVSRRTLFRALAAGGETYTEFLRRTRVSLVQQALLAAPDRPLAQVAGDCGFGGETQMYRAFRRVTGMTPAVYRNRVLRPEHAPVRVPSPALRAASSR